ncbi:MAG: imidazole glycerol phosphate synthase subunit HisH, partial [Longimicrobiales bacterium]
GGARVWIEADPAAAANADALVLPGVGAFPAAASRLVDTGAPLRAAIVGGLPTLGICLGMQLLFDESEEGAGRGLGVIRGRVRRMRAPRLPQMGWNDVESAGDPLFAGTAPLIAYYANSYVTEPLQKDAVVAWSEYGIDRFPAAVRVGSAVGVQFHPEKSGPAGLQLIANFLSEAVR